MTIQKMFLGSDQRQSKQKTRICMCWLNDVQMRSFRTRDPDGNAKRKHTGWKHLIQFPWSNKLFIELFIPS